MAHAIGDRLHAALGSILVQVPLILLVHAQLWPRFVRQCVLRPEAYAEPLLIGQILDHPRVLTLAAVCSLPALFWKRLRWSEIDEKRRARVPVFVAAGVMAITFATHQVNFYYDQAHLVDRLALLALWLLTLVHPAFVPALLVLLMVFITQVYYPLPEAEWIWPDKRLPLDMLVLFLAFLLVKIVTRPKNYVFLLMALCLTGATYSHAAVMKMSIGDHWYAWSLDNHVSNIFVSAYKNGGWLRFVGDEGIVAAAGVLSHFDLAMAFLTLALELSGFLILVSPRATRLLLVCFPLLHVSILLTSGIFFWKWILLDLALLWYVTRLSADAAPAAPAAGSADSVRRVRWWPRLPRWELYSLRNVALSVAVIAGTSSYFYNVPFAWFDSRFINYFEIHGVAASGKRYRLDPRFFAPYDIIFQQSRFYYLVKKPVLAGTYGTVDRIELARALQDATPAELPAIRARFGRVFWHPPRTRNYARFLGTHVANAHRWADETFVLGWFSPPYHFQTSLAPNTFEFQEPLTRVEVEFVEFLFTGQAIEEVGRELVLSVQFTGMRSAPAGTSPAVVGSQPVRAPP